MKAPKIPPGELDRLAALREYDVLDTPAEPAFDALARVAAELLHVPSAVVALIDAERMWAKSSWGLDLCELSRSVSFCAHVVAADDLLVVPDSRLDERFLDNPLVTGPPHVRFYAGAPLRTANGHVLGALAVVASEPRVLDERERELLRLVADQVVGQLELRRKSRLLDAAHAQTRSLVDGMLDGVVVHCADGGIVGTNEAAERILGLREGEIKGRYSSDPRWRAVHPDGTPFPGEQHPAMITLRTGEPQTNVPMGVRRPDGTTTWVRINARAILRPGEPKPYAVVATFRDVTADLAVEEERAAFREKMAQADRLVTAGTLAAGVGHEINNPLAYVTANVEFALDQMQAARGADGVLDEDAKALSDALVDAREGIGRIARIVQGLRAFGPSPRARRPVDVHAALDVSVNLAMHELRAKATLVRDLGDVPPALADDSRLSQVFVNLLVNAAQAFATSDPSRNRVIVRTRTTPEGRIAVEISDNGPGIPPDVIPRMYDPFFTTKPVGKGTGLGLAICHSVVAALDGTIACRSRLGEGTTFTVEVPAAAAKAREIPVTSRGRVLVVDDEEAVLRAVARLLQSRYDVVAIADSREALRVLEEGAAFDVVFCDLMMPHVTGCDLYRRITARRPELALRFVFVTGGIIDEEVRAFLGQIPNERLDKPFSMTDLLAIAARYVHPTA